MNKLPPIPSECINVFDTQSNYIFINNKGHKLPKPLGLAEAIFRLIYLVDILSSLLAALIPVLFIGCLSGGLQADGAFALSSLSSAPIIIINIVIWIIKPLFPTESRMYTYETFLLKYAKRLL